MDYTPPHNLEAERSVLGAVLISNDALDVAAGILQPESFWRKPNGQIFAAMLELLAQRITIDFVTLQMQLDRRGELNDVGGAVYLSSLVDGLPHATNIEHYANIVRDKAVMRRLMALGAKVVAEAAADEVPAMELVAKADAALVELAASTVVGDLTPASALMHAVFPIIEEAHEKKRQITGLQTAWRAIDDLTLGLHPGKLIYIAARTSQGKSAISLNLAVDVAKQGHTVALFSLEDSKDDIAMRMLASDSGVSGYRLRSGWLVDSDWGKLSNSMGALGNAPLFVDDTPRLSVPELRAKCRRLQSAQKLDLVVVDYVQLMHAPGKHENHTRELSVISTGLKQVAKELRVPIIGCLQLNRDNDKEDRRPRLSDLKGTGSFEQDADLVWLLWRDPHDEELTEINIAKQRNGPTGVVKLRFRKESVRFETWTDQGVPVQREFSQ